MASQNKRPLIDAETENIGNKKRKNNPGGGGGGNNEFVAPADFTDDLVEIVFSYLPVLSAARMSLVSSRFRHSWKYCKNMVFDKRLVCGIGHLKVMRAVDMAMNWHVGPKIDNLSICINNCGIKSLLDEWIRIAVRKNVEEIELDYSPTQVSQPVPIGVFEAHLVRTLKLINVKLEKPQRMQQQWVRMTLLKDLRLRCCELKFFKAVFSRCLHLEYLEIFKCRSVGVLWLSASKHRNFRTLKVLGCVDLEEIQMHAPTLETFYYQGSMRKIVMKGRLPRLNGACVHYIPAMSIMPENLFTKLIIGSAHSLTALSLNRVFIEVMCPCLFRQGHPGATEIIFPNLTELEIYMETYTNRTVEDVLYFLKCCPRLEIFLIYLDGCQDKGEGLFRMLMMNTAQMTYNQQFLHLKAMKISEFKSSQHEHDLLEYFVTRSPALKTLALVTSHVSKCRRRSLEFMNHLRNIAVSPFLKISFFRLRP